MPTWVELIESGAGDARGWAERCYRRPVLVRSHAAGEPTCVTVTADGVAEWATRWPCDGLPRRAITFTWDGGGLVDISPDCANADGAAVSALADDARAVARAIVRARAWHDPASGLLLRRLPQACLAECSGPGPCDAAVARWLKRLRFWVYRYQAVAWLAEFGAWERGELARTPDDDLAGRCLWLLAGQSRDLAYEKRPKRAAADWRPKRFPQPFGLL